MIETDTVKMMNLIRFFINAYRHTDVSLIFSSNRIWMTECFKSVQDVSDLVMFERWLVAYQIIHPNTFEALESIIDLNCIEGDLVDFRNSYSYNIYR